MALRLSSWVIVPQRPFFVGNPGAQFAGDDAPLPRDLTAVNAVRIQQDVECDFS